MASAMVVKEDIEAWEKNARANDRRVALFASLCDHKLKVERESGETDHCQHALAPPSDIVGSTSARLQKRCKHPSECPKPATLVGIPVSTYFTLFTSFHDLFIFNNFTIKLNLLFYVFKAARNQVEVCNRNPSTEIPLT